MESCMQAALNSCFGVRSLRFPFYQNAAVIMGVLGSRRPSDKMKVTLTRFGAVRFLFEFAHDDEMRVIVELLQRQIRVKHPPVACNSDGTIEPCKY